MKRCGSLGGQINGTCLFLTSAGLFLTGAGLFLTGAGLLLTGAGLLLTGAGLFLTGAGLFLTGAGLFLTGAGLFLTGAGLFPILSTAATIGFCAQMMPLVLSRTAVHTLTSLCHRRAQRTFTTAARDASSDFSVATLNIHAPIHKRLPCGKRESENVALYMPRNQRIVQMLRQVCSGSRFPSELRTALLRMDCPTLQLQGLGAWKGVACRAGPPSPTPAARALPLP